jgi:hypothetical protein
MAITTTLLTSGDAGWNTAADQSYTTASITPGANCVLVLLMGGVQDAANTNSLFSGGSVTQHTVVSSGSGPTWTKQTFSDPPANFDSHAAVWTAVIGGSDPGSFTVTIDFPDSRAAGMFAYSIHKSTGHDTGTPFGGKIATNAEAGNGAVTATLDAAPATDDHTIALSVVDTDGSGTGATFGTSFGTWTETAEGNGTNEVGWNTGYRTGSTSTSVEWTDVNTGSATTFTSAQAAIVVKAAAGGSTFTGSGAITEADDTVAGTGILGRSGSGAITEGADDATGVGDFTSPARTGSGAVTEADDTVAGVGDYTPADITGSGAITEADDAVSGVGVIFDGLYPASISGKKVLDQHGNVYLTKTFSSWKLANKLSDAKVTSTSTRRTTTSGPGRRGRPASAPRGRRSITSSRSARGSGWSCTSRSAPGSTPRAAAPTGKPPVPAICTTPASR